jgi:predicted small metal-binding protein
MRVIECNFCGEVVSAANDDDLVGALARHVESQHTEADMDEGQLRDMVANGAYDATDS